MTIVTVHDVGEHAGRKAQLPKSKAAANRKIMLAFGSAVAILLFVGTFSFRNIVRSTASDRWVQHTHGVLDQLQELRIAMETMSSGLRGFAVTGNESYLVPYQAALLSIERHTAAVRDLTADNPLQRPRILILERLTRERHESAEKLIAVRRTQGLQAVADAVNGAPRQRLTNDFQILVAEMQDEERQLLARRLADARQSAAQTKAILGFGTVLGLLITAAAGWSVLRDVMRRERAETELRAVNQELEEFAYVASHDLKAPLRVIDNASKWLEEDLQEHLTSEDRENMNLLRGRVGRMEKLLDDLLEYSRIGRATDGRYVELVTGDVLMDNVVALLSPRQGFTVKVSPRFAGIRVRTMPLQQILMNLIDNAIKHHDKKTGCIEVTVEDRAAAYAFAVKDDGPGIPAQFHDQVFKMFQTLRPRDQVEGSGMGLAMVRKNIEVFGGTFDLESAAGRGSIFRFTWPKQQKLKGADA
jgi:signal transduction histidine kinase